MEREARRRRPPNVRQPRTRPTVPDSLPTIQIQAVDFASYVAMHLPLHFAPPLMDRVSEHAGMVQAWKFLQFAFDLNDPSRIPPFQISLTPEEAKSVDRYIANAQILRRATVLREGAKVTVSVHPGGSGEDVVFEAPSHDALTSWAVDFRRCYAVQEAVGFRKVHGILLRHAQTHTDPDREARLDQLAAWRRAENALHGNTLENIAVARYADQQGWHGAAQKIGPNEPPEVLIGEYLHGQYLHNEPNKADIVEARGNVEFLDAWYRYHFLMVTTDLAYLYTGFAALAQSLTAV
jgi:hypothetical protein